MRKQFFTFLLVAAALTLMAAPAAAQSAVTLDFMRVQLWPEYDQPKVLVIYDFQTPTTASYPFQIQLRLPKEASLLAVAQENNSNLVTLPYTGPTAQGDGQILQFSAPTAGIYHVEYYAPLSKTGTTRNFTFRWPGDYAVKELDIRLQEPVGSAHVQTTPTLPDVNVGTDTFTYHQGAFNTLPAGQNFDLQVTYIKSDDALSASGSPVQAAGGSLTNNQTSLSTYLPWIIGGLGVLLIVGGGVWYWLSGRKQPRPTRARHSATINADPEANPATNGQIYCAQCGKRAQPEDHFCRTCGTRIRQKE